MYKFKILFIIFVSLLLFSCNQSVNSLNENQNTPKYNSKADKTIVRTFLIKWKAAKNIIMSPKYVQILPFCDIL